MESKPTTRRGAGRPPIYSKEQIKEVLRLVKEDHEATSKEISERMAEGLRLEPKKVLYVLGRHFRQGGNT